MLESSCHPSELAASTSYAALFVAGLTMSVGHCVGMCGPIQMTFSTEQAQRGPVYGSLALYHTGRILSYMVLGTLLGTLGASSSAFGPGTQTQAVVTALAGIFMIIFVMFGFPQTKHGTPWGPLAAKGVGAFLQTHSPGGRLALGIANGFLPCGPVWAAALAAAGLAHPVTGALLMAAYGLGTTPVLALLGLTARQWTTRTRGRLLRLGGVVVALLGVQLTLRGLAMLGVVPHGSMGPVVLW